MGSVACRCLLRQRMAIFERRRSVTPVRGVHSPTPGALTKRAPFLETEEAAAAHPNRTFYYRRESGSGDDECVSRCTRELELSGGEAARALRRTRAEALARSGDHEAALADYAAALALSVGDLAGGGARPALQYAIGETLAKLGRHGDAVRAFDDCLASAPAHARALYARASSHNALGNLEAAVADYERALKSDDDHRRSPTAGVDDRRPSVALGADAYLAGREAPRGIRPPVLGYPKNSSIFSTVSTPGERERPPNVVLEHSS